MSQDKPQGQKRNTYLEDAFALANAWDSRKRHTPENEAREALKRDVPEVTPRAQKSDEHTAKPAGGKAAVAKQKLRARVPEVAPADEASSGADITKTLDIPVVSATKKPDRAEVEHPQTIEGQAQEPDGQIKDANSQSQDANSQSQDAESQAQDAEDEKGKRKSVDPSKRAVVDPEEAAKKAEAAKKSAPKPKADQPKARRSKGQVLKIVGIVIAILIVVAVGISAYAALNRWVLTDDAADIRGVWRMDGATSSIVISDSTIDLAGEATFEYVLDPGAKNIYEKLSGMSGEARYRFSGDRQSLALFDDGAVDWIDTAKRDFDWFMSCISAKLSGKQEPSLLGDESGVVLHRQTETTVAGAAAADASGEAGGSNANEASGEGA